MNIPSLQLCERYGVSPLGTGFVSGHPEHTFPVFDWKSTVAAVEAIFPEDYPPEVVFRDLQHISDGGVWLFVPGKIWFWDQVKAGEIFVWQNMHTALLGIVLLRGRIHPAYDLKIMEQLFAASVAPYDVLDADECAAQAAEDLIQVVSTSMADEVNAPVYVKK